MGKYYNKDVDKKNTKILDEKKAVNGKKQDKKNDVAESNNEISKKVVEAKLKASNGEKEIDLKEEKKDRKLKKKSRIEICWKCSREGKDLWKCGGCRKAWYCNDDCLRGDWDSHGCYCNKIQEKRRRKTEANLAKANEMKFDDVDKKNTKI